jgi:lipoprotein-anchoring transpeptidase ErfK/SrfK
MKKLVMYSLSIVAMFLFAATAHASDSGTSGIVKIQSAVNGLVKDEAYWTKVWYEKQAKKGKTYKKHVSNSKPKKSSSKSTNFYGSGKVVAKVDISSQTMTVYRGGRRMYTWPVSTGRSGYGTPTGTWKIHRMHKRYYSKKYDNAPMPHAMFYYRGFAVHGTTSIKRLGRRASHGCVRLHPDNAARLFSMVKSGGGVVKVVR